MSDTIFIYSTDTVWGIGGNIHVPKMAERVNLIKGHEEVKPLSILFSDLNMLEDYFSLDYFDRDWLRSFLSIEATLGLPISWLKKKIPIEAYKGSSFICVRVLELKHIQELVEMAGGPVYTTSFNLKNDPPVLSIDDAKKLRDSLCPSAQILGEKTKLSGHSSTIVVFNEDGAHEILRPGKRIEEIEKHIKLLST